MLEYIRNETRGLIPSRANHRVYEIKTYPFGFLLDDQLVIETQQNSFCSIAITADGRLYTKWKDRAYQWSKTPFAVREVMMMQQGPFVISMDDNLYFKYKRVLLPAGVSSFVCHDKRLYVNDEKGEWYKWKNDGSLFIQQSTGIEIGYAEIGDTRYLH